MFKEVVTLYQLDDKATEMGGREAIVKSKREVFANKKSVRQSEFYQAYQSGLEATAIFRIWLEGYEEERVLEYEGKYYTVIRTYEIDDFVELTCTCRKGLLEEANR